MNKKLYEERKRYVESLNSALAPMEDFDEIHYAREPITNEEVVKISDKLGRCVYFTVTGNSLERILKDVARIVLNSELGGRFMPAGLIQNIHKLREVAPLFR